MVKFEATIRQFGEKGEKTGWTYFEIPAEIALQLMPGNKKSFRVKGKLDQFSIQGIAILPMGQGNFILPLNASMRKGIRKKKGAMLQVQLSVDKNPIKPPDGFLACLEDEPRAKAFYESMTLSHRNYFIKWMGAVKKEEAVAKRMSQVIDALSKGLNYAGMYHSLKAERDKLKSF